MSTKALVIGTLGAGCIAAAGIGGYVAARVGSDAAPAAAEIHAAAPADDAGSPTQALEPTAAPVIETPAERPREAAPRTVRRAPVVSAADVPPIADPSERYRPAPEPPPPPPPPPPAPSQPLPVETGPPGALPVVDALSRDPLPVLPDPPAPEPARFIELTVEEDAVIGIRLESAISSETARVEDPVVALVTRDVTVLGRTAIPSGARLEGQVTLVERGGRFRERARLGIRFTRLVLSDESAVELQTETIFRDGESPTGEATSKVGASAVIGAILGGVIGGKKGAVIGGSAGAGAGTAAVMAGGPNAATLLEGTPLTVRLTQPVTLLVERNNDN